MIAGGRQSLTSARGVKKFFPVRKTNTAKTSRICHTAVKVFHSIKFSLKSVLQLLRLRSQEGDTCA